MRIIEMAVSMIEVSLALPRALFNETRITEAKTPMMEMTTRSSIKVKALSRWFFGESDFFTLIVSC